MKLTICVVLVLFGAAYSLFAQTSHLNPTNLPLVDAGSGNQVTLSPASLTGNRTFTFPDASGTIALNGSVIVSTNSTLAGDGTGGNPLGLNLANANSWSATQTFAGMVNTGALDQQGAISSSTGTLAIADDASVTVGDASNSATTDVLSLLHTTTGTAANGIGTGVLFRTEDDGGATEDAARIAGVLSTVADGSETSSLAFFTRDVGGTLAETMTLTGPGNLTLGGSISVTGIGTFGTLSLNGNNIVDVHDLQFSQLTSDISNTVGDVVVGDNLNVTGISSFGGSLILDDIAGGNATTVTEEGIARSADGNFAINTGAAANNGTLSTNGLLSVTGTGRATTSLGDGVHVGRDLTGNAGIELVTAGGPPYIDFTRNGGAVDYDARLILSTDAEMSLLDASLNLNSNDLTGVGTVRVGGATAVTNSRIIVANGHWTSQGSAPTAAGDGTSLAAAVTVSANATDVAGRVEATDGGTIGNGVITVTFNSAYATDPIVVVTPGDNNSASGFFVSNITTTSFNITTTSTVGNGTTTYSFYYHVIEND